MSFDLTTATDGTARTLGTKNYQYNATKGRWDRVTSSTVSAGTGLSANISINYDGYPGNYVSPQYATALVSWNQPVTNFSTSSIIFNFGNGTIYQNTVTQVSGSTTDYQFLFSMNGAVGQFQISSGTVLTSASATNSLIYSPAIAGAYRPYPTLSLVSRYSAVPVYTITDTFFPGVVRYFSTATGSTTAADIRVKTVLQNLTSVAPSSYLVSDIVQNPTGQFTIGNMYNSPTSTVASIATDSTRYSDFYYTSTPITTNRTVRLSVAAGAYQDASSPNDAGVPIYFASIPSSATTSATIIKAAQAQVSGLTVTFDHFLALLKDNLLPTTSTVSVSTGTISNLRIDTSWSTGTRMLLNYTPAVSPVDYTETITFPPGWATFSGTSTNITKDPVGAANPFNLRPTLVSTTTFGVFRSPITVVSTTPTNGATAVSTTTVTIRFSRPISYYGISPTYRYYTVTATNNLVFSSALSTGIVNTTTVVVPYPGMLPSTQYLLEVDKDIFRDDYGNLTPLTTCTFTTDVAPASQIIYISSYTTGTFVIPSFVNSISVLAVSAGASGYGGCSGTKPAPGGTGGDLAYTNNIPVTPGDVWIYGAGYNSFLRKNYGTPLVVQAVTGGVGSTGTVRQAGGAGGAGPAGVGGGGGGAAGYYGNGGAGGGNITVGEAGQNAVTGSGGGGGGGGSAGGGSCIGGGGGGVGLYGPGSTGIGGIIGNGGGGGSGGAAANYSFGGAYGGGGGGCAYTCTSGSRGGDGALRIVWGAGRSFPNTNIASTSS